MRYSRHLLVDRFTSIHQQKIKDASVLVIGAGGLGSAILMYLAAAGIGRIGIVDYDSISVSNLNRQILYHPGIIEQSKVNEAAKRIKELNPDCSIEVFNTKLTNDNAQSIIEQFDVIADATDNFTTRYIADATCKKLNRPFVYGTAEQWSGQISVFHYQGAGGYCDLYPQQNETHASTPGIIGPMAGVIGTRQAIEIIKIVTGLGEVLSNKLLIIDALNNQDMILNIKPSGK